MLASRIPWHKLAADLLNREMGAVDPSFLFEWPLARVLAVFFLDDVKPREDAVDVSTPEKWKKVMAELRAKRNKGG